jgi:alpha-L-arabinofuranosidase
MFKRITKFVVLFTTILMTIPFLVSADYVAGVRDRMGNNKNRIDIAYKDNNFKLLEELVRVDESDIIDETVSVKLNVDETNIVRDKINDRMLGIGWETAFHSPELYFKPNTLEISDEFKEMASRFYNVPLARWGGACTIAQGTFSSIGKMEARDRMRIVDAFYDNNEHIGGIGHTTNEPEEMGIVEFVKMARTLNPNVEFVISLPVDSHTVDDLVNLVRFYMDPPDKSEFGALRASLGLPEPVNVICFEFGNEVYTMEWDGTRDPDVEYGLRTKNYCEKFKEFYSKVHPLVPEAKFGVPLEHNPHRRPGLWDIWNKTIAAEIGQYLDFAIPHNYYSGYEINFWGWWLDAQYKTFTDVLGEDCKIKFLSTEHGMWYEDSKNFKTHSLHGVLAVAQFYNNMYADYPFVEGASYYQWYNSSWACVKRIQNEYVIMGLPQMFEVYQKNLGDKVVKSELVSDSEYTDVNSGGRRFTCMAMTKDNDELVVYLTNRLAYTDFNLEFDFKNEYTLIEETVFTAPNIFSFAANKATEDVFETRTTPMNIENIKSYNMPSKSLVILRFKKMN